MNARHVLFILLVAASFAAPSISSSQPSTVPTASLAPANLSALAVDPVTPLKTRIMGYTVTSFPKSN